ncbi:MAG: bifunctional demethylmenaquinone methyltransferase/2-methoxy-6-polyprenyl-1,4-benzoquinol methylase UbiE [bacterium]
MGIASDTIMTSKDKVISPSRSGVGQMFDRIAHRYDLLNRLLSFGRDQAWRRQLVGYVPNDRPLELLDLACGTADVMLTLLHHRPNIEHAMGLDLSANMLKLAKHKTRAITPATGFVRGGADRMPFASASFDLVTVAFGVRNFKYLETSLREVYRVLKPGGRLLVLEFSLPQNRFWRWIYLRYFRTILPIVGGFISGDSQAYRYLNQSVESFPYGRSFCRLLKEAGFSDTQNRPLTLGVASVYCAMAGAGGNRSTELKR